MNFAIRLDPPTILVTGEAVDNVAVFGSLRMARAALDDGVTARIAHERLRLANLIENAELETAADIATLRAARKAALKVREADLPSDTPAPSGTAGDTPPRPGASGLPPVEATQASPQAEGAGDDRAALVEALRAAVNYEINTRAMGKNDPIWLDAARAALAAAAPASPDGLRRAGTQPEEVK